jgi:hypothetical protein
MTMVRGQLHAAVHDWQNLYIISAIVLRGSTLHRNTRLLR